MPGQRRPEDWFFTTHTHAQHINRRIGGQRGRHAGRVLVQQAAAAAGRQEEAGGPPCRQQDGQRPGRCAPAAQQLGVAHQVGLEHATDVLGVTRAPAPAQLDPARQHQ